jgi:hypothetical protein
MFEVVRVVVVSMLSRNLLLYIRCWRRVDRHAWRCGVTLRVLGKRELRGVFFWCALLSLRVKN